MKKIHTTNSIQKIFNFIMNIKKNKNEKEIFKYLNL